MEFSRATQVAWRKIGDETMVVDLKAKTLFGLNVEAGAVWHALDEPRSVSQLVRVLCPPDSGQAHAEALERAVDGFLAELLELGLVETVPPSGPEEEPRVSNRLSLDGVPLPKIIWRDEIRNFGVSCSMQAGNPGCQAVPTI